MYLQGYIKLYRQVLDNPIWLETPFSKGQAWADLLLLANFKDNTMLKGNEIISIKRGELHTSELNLAKRWGWTRKKVRGFLRLLVSQGMVTTQGTTQGTTIRIEMYAFFQDSGPAEGTTEGTAEGQRRANRGTQRKKEKNEENGKKDIYGDLPQELHQPLKDYVDMRKGMGKQKAMTERAIELLLRKLVKLSSGDIRLQITMLEEATEKNWLSVYLPKEDKPKQGANEVSNYLDQVIKGGMRNEPNGSRENYETDIVAIPGPV